MKRGAIVIESSVHQKNFEWTQEVRPPEKGTRRKTHSDCATTRGG
jgi:hypothetical protein